MATVILGAARTPFGKVGGALAPVSAVELGKTAAKAAIERAGVEPGDFDYTIFGQVIQAGVGHIPSRQVALGVGVPDHIGSDTINKVCASRRAATATASATPRSRTRCSRTRCATPGPAS